MRITKGKKGLRTPKKNNEVNNEEVGGMTNGQERPEVV